MGKQELRERVWDELEETGEARFPFPPHGRIPNFAGAHDATNRLTELSEWQGANVIKSNPDSPQLPVRRAALREGKTVYMAVPRLRDEKCFIRLEPEKIDDTDHSATLGGSSELGEQVDPDQLRPVDLIVSGSVAVDKRGSRVGKGEGFSDIEFAVLRELGLVGNDTTTTTTVHECQVVDVEVETGPHDVPLDLIVTPEQVIRTADRAKPSGIDWSLLDEEQIAETPVLEQFNR